MSSAESDILIVGAGMTGLALALALADEGFSVEVIDPQQADIGSFDEQFESLSGAIPGARVSALTLGSEQLLRGLKVWARIEQTRSEPYSRMQVWDGETRGEISFDAKDLHEAWLGHIVENPLIVLALLERAMSHPDVKLSFGLSLKALDLSSARPSALLSDDSNRHCNLVIGADGANSITRKAAGVGTHEWDYGHHALVATLCVERSHQHCCWQRFTEDGPLALLPLKSPGNDRVSLVWSTSPEHAQELYSLDDAGLAAVLTRASEEQLGRVTEVHNRALIPLRQRHAQHYVKTGVALVGDAAHTIHPLAGQGVNLGFTDVAALVDILCEARERGEDFASERVLRRYQRRQMLLNLRMSALVQGFRTLFTPQPALVEWARSVGMRAVDQCGPLKQHLMLDAMGLRGDLPKLMRRPLKI